MPSTTWIPDIAPRVGYDTLLGEAKQEGVTGELETQVGGDGQQGDTSFRLVQTAEEFDNELGITSELSVGLGAFSGNAKFSFKQRNKVSAQSTFCIVRVFALNAYQRLTNTKLTTEASGLIEDNKMDRFRERFGDFYVSGQQTGVEFFGVIRIEAESVQKQKDIAASIQASYGLSISGSASLAYSENMSSSRHSIEASTFQRGGHVALAITLDELINQARQALQQSREGAGFPFALELNSYKELEWPADGEDPIDVKEAQANIDAMAKHTQAFRQMSEDINFILRHQDWFENPDIDALNTVNQRLTTELNELHRRAKICATDRVACALYTPVYPELALPARKVGAPGTFVPGIIGKGRGEVRTELEGLGIAHQEIHTLLKEPTLPGEGSFRVVASDPDEGDGITNGTVVKFYTGHKFSATWNALHAPGSVRQADLSEAWQKRIDDGRRRGIEGG